MRGHRPDAVARRHSSAVTINPSLHENTGYQQSGLAPVILLATYRCVIAVDPESVPAHTMGEFIAHAKSKVGGMSWASRAEEAASSRAGDSPPES